MTMKRSQSDKFLEDQEKKNVIIPEICSASYLKFMWIDRKTTSHFPECSQIR